ncbi:hypothetical protein CYMTET_4546 [Cymbomonas tetramitiformis]|uniref:BTB domain-containing protein n=1 Tax=Cymbomonas tetramitiformis TaxID=36881 RepID=A0AAE0EWU9_9CHLO|nr:hypothetical protein CYMTET_47224 [Cymbomonas tetramitiformis]KAK3287992.1 hypothetical protein CYMTET_4546 [Cymbomonas tetramitiformis]
MLAPENRPTFAFQVPERGGRDPLSDARVRLMDESATPVAEYDCHRFMLACASTHLREVFSLFPNERRFEFRSFGAREFETLLNVLYNRHTLSESVSRICEKTESFVSHFRMFEYLGCDVFITACANSISGVITREVNRFVRSETCCLHELHALCERHELRTLSERREGKLRRPLDNALTHRLITTVKNDFLNVLRARETCDDRSVSNFRRLLALPFVNFEDVVHREHSVSFKISTALHWCDEKEKLRATREYMSQFWIWTRDVETDAWPGLKTGGDRYAPTDTLACLKWHIKTNAWMFARTAEPFHRRFWPVRVALAVDPGGERGDFTVRVSLRPRYRGCLPLFWATADGLRCFGEFLLNAHISETMQ